MNTKTHSDESADSRLIAYGKEVGELLSSSSVQTWTNELWTMFSSFMIAQNETGHTPNLSNTYFSFKELLEFFEKVEVIRKTQQST
jgi:hypothetical protein